MFWLGLAIGLAALPILILLAFVAIDFLNNLTIGGWSWALRYFRAGDDIDSAVVFLNEVGFRTKRWRRWVWCWREK